MVKRDLLTRDEAEAADLNIIHAFFESETGRRMRKAECVRREVPFNYRKKAHEIMDNMQPGHDTLLIQGVIDCFFEEEGQWVIVDYKTDYVDSPERVNELVKALPEADEFVFRSTGADHRQTCKGKDTVLSEHKSGY